ncbi:MAG: cobyrinate a,c-diamide synthase [Nitrospirae bacterium]|nr:cobyrinate a,c-diamide synthase [Nitrospirota bacterium]
MSTKYPRIVIAGLRGGSGKTTLSLGLIAALAGAGSRIVPFKKGPDYIDAGWLSSAAKRPCYNLDPFMIGRERVLTSFLDHFGGADCAVIEGNRGIYDGMDSEGAFSTAELAKILKAPVILVLDCTKVTRTAAAMVYGMQTFDRGVDIRGVVLNRISGARHEKTIRESIEKYCGIEVLGALPGLKKEFLSERHMGLTPFQEHPEVAVSISLTAETVRRHVDIARILDIARGAKPLKAGNVLKVPSPPPSPSGGEGFNNTRINNEAARIGVIRDTAFQFYYPENFEELQKRGAELVEISALTEKKLPDIDALYIGGGFPETNAIALARNRSFRGSLRDEIDRGLPVYAECGGLMYLGNSLVLEGRRYPMTGVFPLDFEMSSKPAAHGYTVVRVSGRNPFFAVGTILRGHEFHYSGAIITKGAAPGKYAYDMERGQGISNRKDGIFYKNVLASYTHLHAYGAPQWADGMLRQAEAYRKKGRKIVKKR